MSTYLISEHIDLINPSRSAAESRQFYLPNFSGEGRFWFNYTNEHGAVGKVSISWENARCDFETKNVSFSIKIEGQSYTLATLSGPRFPSISDGRVEGGNIRQRFGWTSKFELCVQFNGRDGLEFDGSVKKTRSRTDSETLTVPAKRLPLPRFHATEFLENVRVYFPLTQSEIWTTESFLKGATDHFDPLFSPDYNEGKILNAIRNDKSTYEKDFQDSDDEDETETLSDVFMEESAEPVRSGAPFKQIKIEAIAHSTYQAFLHWLDTTEIVFSPLSSSFRLLEDPVAARKVTIENLIQKNPTLPSPVSPKSIYRLAHYYNIQELKEIALQAIKSQLTMDNIVFELFQIKNLSTQFEEVKEMEIMFAGENWNEIKDSKSMAEIYKLVDLGKIGESFLPILCKLVSFLGPASKKRPLPTS